MENQTNDSRFIPEDSPSEETVPAKALDGNVYNTDCTDVDLESYSDEVLFGEQKSLRGWLLTIIFLLAGILAVLIFWLIRYKDLFL